jgi:hypothetical protein
MIGNNGLVNNALTLEATTSGGGNEYSGRLNVVWFKSGIDVETTSVAIATRSRVLAQRLDVARIPSMERADLFDIYDKGGTQAQDKYDVLPSAIEG